MHRVREKSGRTAYSPGAEIMRRKRKRNQEGKNEAEMPEV
jgi:hypothetical protein